MPDQHDGETRDEYLKRINSTTFDSAGVARPRGSIPPEKKPKPGKGTIIALVLFVAVVIGGISALVAGGSSSSSSSGGNSAGSSDLVVDDVYNVCKQFVERRLEYPGSSDFQGIDDADVSIDGKDGTDISYVDAANGFGAKSRRPFTCTVHSTGRGGWRLTKLDIDLS